MSTPSFDLPSLDNDRKFLICRERLEADNLVFIGQMQQFADCFGIDDFAGAKAYAKDNGWHLVIDGGPGSLYQEFAAKWDTPPQELFSDVRERRELAELRRRVEARVALGVAGEMQGKTMVEDLAAISALVEKLAGVMDLHVMSKGYHFFVGADYQVHALTAGDQHYEPTRFKVDMTGWQLQHGVDETEKRGDWQKNWRPYVQGSQPGFNAPALHEVVVVKTPAGVMSYDWMQVAGNHGMAFFSENHGVPHLWMPKDVFEAEAPEWARGSVEPLTEDALTNLARLKQATPVVAEPTPEYQPVLEECTHSRCITHGCDGFCTRPF